MAGVCNSSLLSVGKSQEKLVQGISSPSSVLAVMAEREKEFKNLFEDKAAANRHLKTISERSNYQNH